MLFRIILVTIAISISNNLFAQCAGQQSFTLNPQPTNNTYSPGTVVTVCYTMTGWNGTGFGSNWLIAKDTIMLWFVDNEDYIDKLNSGEYDMVMFPIRTLSNAFTVSPITDVWKLSKSRGKKEVLGMINAYLYKDELVIGMMSVRGAWQGNRINSFNDRFS